jgi:UDP-N-acetylmuramate: L-alanyl-gamma-D-glutamyl-meso-diaminopimelate ligase
MQDSVPEQWVHFVAIGGTGMGALASLLQDLGFFVTGSDGVLYPPMSDFLDSRKISRAEGYDVKHLTGAHWGRTQKHPNLVIVGNAISRGNVEADLIESLVAQGLTKRMSFAEGLATFGIAEKESYVVAGTHGKTTTTSLLTWAFEALGSEPGFFIGGIPANFGMGCRLGEGRVFVSEGDEYDTAYWDKVSKFLHYKPHWVLCTGVEYDHADIYPDLQSIQRSFEKLVDKTRSGWVLVEAESAPRPEVVDALAAKLRAQKLPVFRYGFSANSEYRIKSFSNLTLPDGRVGTELTVLLPQMGEIKILSPMSGRHNALNLLGVVSVLHASKKLSSLEPEKIRNLFLGFKGIKRRQEELYRDSRLVVIDDFAHHPTAIRETVSAVRGRYPLAKIFAFFEARSATSARNIFLEEFGEAFNDAHEVFLVPPTKSNVPTNEKLDIEGVAARVRKKGIPVTVEKDIGLLKDRFFESFSKNSSTPVVALVMSNGAFGGLHQKIIGEVKSHLGK